MSPHVTKTSSKTLLPPPKMQAWRTTQRQQVWLHHITIPSTTTTYNYLQLLRQLLQLPTTPTTTPCYLHLHTLYNTTIHHGSIHNSTHPPLLLSHHPHELMQRFEAIWSQFMQPSSNKQQQYIRDDGTKTHNTMNYIQQ